MCYDRIMTISGGNIEMSWKNETCPWGDSTCKEKERMRDIALPLIPKYNELLRPLANGLIEVSQTKMDIPPDGLSVCLAISKMSRSCTKANPVFTLKVTSNWYVRENHRLSYGEHNWSWRLLSLDAELGGWLKMSVGSDRWQGFSFDVDNWLWMRPWPEQQKIKIVRQNGVVCPECGKWRADYGGVHMMKEFEGKGVVDAFACAECHLWMPRDDMKEYEQLETIPDDIRENELVLVYDDRADLDSV